MFHPRLCSQTVRRAPFNLALPISCSVSHTPPSPSHLWPSFLISARLEFTLFPDLSDVAQHFQQTLHFARATHVVRFWPLTVLLHPPPPPGMCRMKADTRTCVAAPILSACHGSAALPRRDSLFSGTERCRLHLRGAAPCLPADTRHQRKRVKKTGA